MRTQTSVDKSINDLRYEIKFENCVKDKITLVLSKTLNFFLNGNIFYSRKYIFFYFPKNLITSAFFSPRQVLKNIDIPWQKPQMLYW